MCSVCSNGSYYSEIITEYTICSDALTQPLEVSRKCGRWLNTMPFFCTFLHISLSAKWIKEGYFGHKSLTIITHNVKLDLDQLNIKYLC